MKTGVQRFAIFAIFLSAAFTGNDAGAVKNARTHAKTIFKEIYRGLQTDGQIGAQDLFPLIKINHPDITTEKIEQLISKTDFSGLLDADEWERLMNGNIKYFAKNSGLLSYIANDANSERNGIDATKLALSILQLPDTELKPDAKDHILFSLLGEDSLDILYKSEVSMRAPAFTDRIFINEQVEKLAKTKYKKKT